MTPLFMARMERLPPEPKRVHRADRRYIRAVARLMRERLGLPVWER